MSIQLFHKILRPLLNYEQLGSLVRSLQINRQDIAEDIPPINTKGKYARHIYTLDPLEIALLHWPPGAESAVHHHKGFWGYVYVVDGICDNVVYKEEGGVLSEHSILRAIAGGVLNEPDDTIHKICNPSSEESLLTLHFYFPPLSNLDGLTLFDTKTKRKGILNEKAESASFLENPSHFHSLEKDAFIFKPFEKTSNKSHRIYPIIPKPNDEIITKMIASYYDEQAHEYDHFDTQHESRNRYTERINQLIANDLKHKSEVSEVLSIACGTGRRALSIQEQSGLDYNVYGMDISSEMIACAKEKGLKVRVANILEDPKIHHKFDAITYLYSFGHLSSREQRRTALRHIYAMLNEGGKLYLDVFNAQDETEWGPKAKKRFDQDELALWGYEQGDVFYKKLDGQSVAYLHYFSSAEIKALLEEAGFLIDEIKYVGYVNRAGECLKGPFEGSIFIQAVKMT